MGFAPPASSIRLKPAGGKRELDKQVGLPEIENKECSREERNFPGSITSIILQHRHIQRSLGIN
jgi:hypothetical protein